MIIVAVITIMIINGNACNDNNATDDYSNKT